MRSIRSPLHFLLLLLVCAASLPVGAQSWPDRPIRSVIPYSPGGGVDPLARMIGQRLTEDWRQPVIIDNKPGCNTFIGANPVAGAAPRRFPAYPDVPTFKEAIGHEFLVDRVGLFAPAGTPPAIIGKLSREVSNFLKLTSTHDFYAKRGWGVPHETSQDYPALLEQDRAAWARLVKEAGVKPE